jgi:hypothetical protein
MLGEWILTARGRISSESVVAESKKCCISSALDGTEVDFLWQVAESGNGESDCEEDNGEEESGNENSE